MQVIGSRVSLTSHILQFWLLLNRKFGALHKSNTIRYKRWGCVVEEASGINISNCFKYKIWAVSDKSCSLTSDGHYKASEKEVCIYT